MECSIIFQRIFQIQYKKKLPDKVPEDMSEYMPEDLSDKMPEEISE